MKKNIHKTRYPYIVILLICVFAAGFIGALYVLRLPSVFLDMRLPVKGQIIHFISMKMSPRVAYEVLGRLVGSEDIGVLHDLIPVIGESAYKHVGSAAYSFCDTLTHPLPCYYGVMLGAVQVHGYSSDTMRVISSECMQSSQVSSQDRCLQGVGYTIMLLNKYWYIESLQFCDAVFGATNERYQCWIGVTHENVNRVGDILHGLHEVPWANDNVYYPCDSIPLLYQPACVREQMLSIRARKYNNDTKSSATYCSYFTHDETRNSCIKTLMHVIIDDAKKQNTHDLSQCRQLPNEYVDLCVKEFQR